MRQILHTFECPLGSGLRYVCDVNIPLTVYDERRAAGEYPLVVDIPNWQEVMGDVPKPDFPLTDTTAAVLGAVVCRYVSGNELLRDVLDDFMEQRSPNSKAR